MADIVSRKHDIKVALIASLATIAVIAGLAFGFFASVTPAQAYSFCPVAQGNASNASTICAVTCQSLNSVAAQNLENAQLASTQGQVVTDLQGAPVPSGNGLSLADTSGTGTAANAYCPNYPNGGCPYGGTAYGCSHEACGYCNNTGHQANDCPYKTTAPSCRGYGQDCQPYTSSQGQHHNSGHHSN